MCCGPRAGNSEPLAKARDTKKTDLKALFSLWMPRRKSPICTLPVLIQFRGAADTNTPLSLLLTCEHKIGTMRPSLLAITPSSTPRENVTMKRWSAVTLALLLVAITAVWHSYQAFGQSEAGWITLFDGKSLENWNQIGDAN